MESLVRSGKMRRHLIAAATLALLGCDSGDEYTCSGSAGGGGGNL